MEWGFLQVQFSPAFAGFSLLQDTRHLLLEAVVERFLRRRLGVVARTARALRGLRGRCPFIRDRCRRLARWLGRGRGARLLRLERAQLRRAWPRGRRGLRCERPALRRGLTGHLAAGGSARFVALAGTAQRSLESLR